MFLFIDNKLIKTTGFKNMYFHFQFSLNTRGLQKVLLLFVFSPSCAKIWNTFSSICKYSLKLYNNKKNRDSWYLTQLRTLELRFFLVKYVFIKKGGNDDIIFFPFKTASYQLDCKFVFVLLNTMETL